MEEALTAISRQTRALTAWALRRRLADDEIGKVKAECETAAHAEREKTSRLKLIRMAREAAQYESACAKEGTRRASS
jgi:hypothetical protein